jgi:hypothetical protein
MADQCVIYGSWKIRHNEPLSDDEKELDMYLLSSIDTKNRLSVILDSAGALEKIYPPETNALRRRSGPPKFAAGNFPDGDKIPLAIADFDENMCAVTHLLLRIETYACHFIKMPELPLPSAFDDMVNRLVAIYQKRHLQLNNYECLYFPPLGNKVLRQTFSLGKPMDFFNMGRKLYEMLDEDYFTGFRPQMGAGMQQAAFKSERFSIMENKRGFGGEIATNRYSRNLKRNWDEERATFEMTYQRDGAPCCYQETHDEPISGRSPDLAAAEIFGLPLSGNGEERRACSSVVFESLAAGNIFNVRFGNIYPVKDRKDIGGLGFGAVRYIKSRTACAPEEVEFEFKLLCSAIEQFIGEYRSE